MIKKKSIDVHIILFFLTLLGNYVHHRMDGKNEIYLKIIRGAELSEQEKAYKQKEKESDPELGLLLDELRHMHQEASEIPKVFLHEERRV